jgi:hypothetical protein
MRNSVSKGYVRWFNESSAGKWATWEPGDLVQPGDVGNFNNELRFAHWMTLAEYGIPYEISPERPTLDRSYINANSFNFETKTSGEISPKFTTLGKVDAGLKLVSTKQGARILQVKNATESCLTEPADLLNAIAAVVRGERGPKWPIDSMVVFDRIQANTGFAAISHAAGQSIELRASGEISVAPNVGALTADATLSSNRDATGFLLYEFSGFSGTATPIFGPPLRVKQSWWSRLLPWEHDGDSIVDPVGQRWSVNKLPHNLSYLPIEARSYDPRRSAICKEELEEIALADLFEYVLSVSDLDDPDPSPGPALAQA